MHLKATPMAAACVALLGGCASVPESDEYVAVGDPKSLAYIAPGTDSVAVDFPAGELLVRGTDSDNLLARLVIRCPADSESCVERASQVSLARHDDGPGVRIAVENAPVLKMAGAQLDMTVEVPASADVVVDMGFGEMTVEGIAGCLIADLGAGQVSVTGPLTAVQSVWLDAGTGDATLRTPAGLVEGRRSWLVGAEVDWRQGPGSCRMEIDVNAGEIDVRLE